MKTEKIYMNIDTGSTGTRDEWWYEDENGEQANGVDQGKLTEVISDGNGWWNEV